MIDAEAVGQFVDEIRAAEKARAGREQATLKLAAANVELLKAILEEMRAARAELGELRAWAQAQEEPAPAAAPPVELNRGSGMIEDKQGAAVCKCGHIRLNHKDGDGSCAALIDNGTVPRPECPCTEWGPRE